MAKGFDGRMFLTDAELECYERRMPVRYLKHKLEPICFICGLTATSDNPFERAHRVPFGKGILMYRLTPDWLDGAHNIVTAHKKGCNKASELSHITVLALITKPA